MAPEDKTTPPTPDIPSSPACGGILQTEGTEEEPTMPSEPTAGVMVSTNFRPPLPPPPMHHPPQPQPCESTVQGLLH